MHETKIMESLEEKVMDELEKICKKPDMSPTELENANKALSMIEKVRKLSMDDGHFDEGTSSHYPTRYDITRWPGSYDMPRDQYSRTYNSYTRRNPRTGRYMMSSHSIKDRMIDKLESMMDEASSDYEREKISEWISHLEKD